MNKIRSYFPFILFTFMVIVGILIMFYPVISNMINESSQNTVIINYQNITDQYQSSENQKMLDQAYQYNANLHPTSVEDAFSNPGRKESSEYLSILNIDKNGVMGYLSIPKIDVKIPIYHGTSSKVLQKGVGHLEGSSFPVGGTGTHAILSAHRGLPSARLFTDLNQLQIGDMFYVYVLNQVLAYQVDQVLVVEPSETEALQLQSNQDYITLVTCTPYAINTHRLLVRGSRVEYSEQVLNNISTERKASISDIFLYVSLFIVILFFLIMILIIVRNKIKKKKVVSIDEEII